MAEFLHYNDSFYFILKTNENDRGNEDKIVSFEMKDKSNGQVILSSDDGMVMDEIFHHKYDPKTGRLTEKRSIFGDHTIQYFYTRAGELERTIETCLSGDSLGTCVKIVDYPTDGGILKRVTFFNRHGDGEVEIYDCDDEDRV